MESVAEQYDIPFGPSGDVVSLAYSLAKTYVEQEQYRHEHYFIMIANELMESDETNELLAVIDKHKP